MDMFPTPTFRLFAFAGMVSAAAVTAQIPTGIALTPAFNSSGSGAFGKLAGMEEIPGKPGHFLVVELKGKITLLTPSAGGHTRSLFAQIPINTEDEDQGMSSLAFHPNFASNRKYYYRRGDAAVTPRGLRILEGEAQADGLKDAGKAHRVLMTINMPGEFADHNGGGIGFGRDGYLYLGVGDGGWDLKSPDVHNNGQNRETLLGKVLRIDVDRKDAGLEYGIPQDNPFVQDPNAKVRREIYAYGLRNPFRMSFDRASGELYVADVGLANFEKVFVLKKGGNYGWKLQEHTLCFTPGTCGGITVEPAAGYMAYGQVKCFVGGHVYRGNPQSPFYGVYLFGDHTAKRLLAFRKGAAPVVVTDLMAAPEMTGFTLDGLNNVYLLGYRGTIHRLEHKDLQPQATTALRPLAAGRSGMAGRIFRVNGTSVTALAPGDPAPRARGLLLSAPAR